MLEIKINASETKCNTLYCYCINSLTSISIKKLVKFARRELTYLFELEDSTDRVDNSKRDYSNLEANSTRGLVKAVFWIAASILIPLALEL